MSFGVGSPPKPRPLPTPAAQADASVSAGEEQLSTIPSSLITTSTQGLQRKAKTLKTSLIGGS